MKVRLLSATLGFALALSALTGVASAGKPDEPGKSAEAPGQVKKAEEAPAGAAAAAASGGETKAEAEASATASVKASAKATAGARQQARLSGPGVKPGNSTDKWTTCATGGGQGAAATCARTDGGTGTGSDKADASKQYGHGGTAAQIANGRGAPGGTVLTGPGNSQPHKVAVCPFKSNRSGGVDVHAVKSYDTAACEEQRQEAPRVDVQAQPTVQPTVEVQVSAGQQEQRAAEAPVQAAAPKQQGGVLGAQAGRPAAGPQDQGGVLGEVGAVTQGELPFTGLPLWLALFAGAALVGAGVGIRKGIR